MPSLDFAQHQTVVDIVKIVLVDLLAAGQQRCLGASLGLRFVLRDEKSIGVLFGQLGRFIAADIDEIQPLVAAGRFIAQLDAVAVDLGQAGIGIDMQALRLTEPLAEQLLMHRFKGIADGEGNVVQLDATARSATAEHDGMQCRNGLGHGGSVRRWMPGYSGTDAEIEQSRATLPAWWLWIPRLLEPIAEQQIRVDDHALWVAAIELQQIGAQLGKIPFA